MNFASGRLGISSLRFSASNPAATSDEKFRGLQRHGPYQPLPFEHAPTFAFVFPREFREDALRLYFALRNGIRFFKGFESLFRVPFTKDQVVDISGFSIADAPSVTAQAAAYTNAVECWLESNERRPDLFVLVHPRTQPWQQESPYYRCKAALLSRGLTSQSVTVDLVRNSREFEWSAANIALASFAKLGGVPWIVDDVDLSNEIVVGMGRADVRDPRSRRPTRFIAFATCVRSNGMFEFVVFGKPTTTTDDYHAALEGVLVDAFQRLESKPARNRSVGLHLPKEYGRAEQETIIRATQKCDYASAFTVETLKVSDEREFFLVDEESNQGIPPRGSYVRISDRDWCVYTEGREDKHAWRDRTPSAIRVRNFSHEMEDDRRLDCIRQILDLSQVNYRAFNARSQPVSLVYSKLIARTLGQMSSSDAARLGDVATTASRMWFL